MSVAINTIINSFKNVALIKVQKYYNQIILKISNLKV